MTKYGILINTQTGIPAHDAGFLEHEFPPVNVLPDNIQVVVFTEQVKDFELLKSFFFGDPERLTADYKQSTLGGVVYDFDTQEFSFHKRDLSINLNSLKEVRDNLLRDTDKYMLIPDLPADIKADITAYRQQLRDITTKVGTEWNTVYDIQWPEFPEKLIIKPIQPPPAAA